MLLNISLFEALIACQNPFPQMHISFSLDGTVHQLAPQSNSFPSDFIQFFLNSVGATLSEIKDVELRMAYFERRGAVLTWAQLMAEVQHHYVSQGVQQAYVLLLGLDVLGNPYGLVRDFTQGLGDFFYEPFLVRIWSFLFPILILRVFLLVGYDNRVYCSRIVKF